MRILIITNVIPYPLISGGSVRIYNLVRRIAKQHQVWLAAFVETTEQARAVSHLKDFCCGVEIAYLRRKHPLVHLPGLLWYALAGRPVELKFTYSKELADKIHNLVSTMDFDIVQIEPSPLALYREAIPPETNSKHILTFYDIAFQQYKRIARFQSKPIRKIRAWLHSIMMRYWEPRYAERFDRCITVSEVDRRVLITANPNLRIDVIPNGVDTQMHQCLPQEDISPALLFVGKMSYPPNTDAVIYFCQEIFPRIRRRLDEVELWLVGSQPVPEVMKFNGNGVHVTGQVESVISYYRRSSICVVPLRSGGGTRLKILEAMALGRPVVTTSIGAEGLDVIDGEHLFIADSPEEFAEMTIRLLTDKALWQRITSNARHLVVKRYDWDKIAKQLMQIYEEMDQ